MKNVVSVDYELLLCKLINEIINLDIEHHTTFCHNDITKIWNQICCLQCIEVFIDIISYLNMMITMATLES